MRLRRNYWSNGLLTEASFDDDRRPADTDHQHSILLAEDLVVDIHAEYGVGPKLLSR